MKTIYKSPESSFYNSVTFTGNTIFDIEITDNGEEFYNLNISIGGRQNADSINNITLFGIYPSSLEIIANKFISAAQALYDEIETKN